MTGVWPLRFSSTTDNRLVFADESGAFFLSDEDFLSRYAKNTLSEHDEKFLLEGGHAFSAENDPAFNAFSYRWAKRHTASKDLTYIILVPTLRCNLSCVYCQVSRAAETARGYDWSEETLDQTLSFLSSLESEEIKVEFQGGEPLLRIDLLERVREHCRQQFKKSEFVVCTNLQRLDERAWAFLSAADTFVSTSLDGDKATHERQRTLTTDRIRRHVGSTIVDGRLQWVRRFTVLVLVLSILLALTSMEDDICKSEVGPVIVGCILNADMILLIWNKRVGNWLQM